MSEKRNDGGPAFPVDRAAWDMDRLPGMSLRDWFAGQALTGAMVNVTGMGSLSPDDRNSLYKQVSSLLYELADAMVAEREK